ncbi:hypothetical protein RQP53_07905 [Paucibacter sp. APW11]|uniref:Tetratricopeptide repeat protein n=1 Tax=Roseateles aquae TaxID=3077235 RepID=A0ABU3P9D6_9BURK|nr:hypothetical protein [Paucibacter sp. APW11]MDT8999189.1 hypothetical protein [Paucibacter sp. APW11]
MKLRTLATVAVGAVAFAFGAGPQGDFGFATVQAQAEGVRAEVGKYLKDASALIKAGKYKDALAKVHDAEGVANRNGTENYAIEGMRVAAASGAGDADSMVKGLEAMKASGKLPAANQLPMMESIAGTYLRNGNAAKALEWSNKYFQAGGTSATVKTIQTQAQLKSGDMGAVMKDTMAEITAEEKAGRTPSQDKLNLLMYAASKKGDSGTEALATEKLLNYYPRKELWAQVLGTLPTKKTFSDRFSLDVYRLKLATGNMKEANDYMEMAQLAMQAGVPDEAKQVVDKGFSANLLGQGSEGARHKRLQDLITKRVAEAKAAQSAAEKDAQEAKDGNALVPLGLGFAFRGDAAKGAKLIEQAIAKDSLKRPEDAKLYQGIALFMAGDTAKAQSVWRSVKGTDGSAELARLWVIHARAGK